MARQQARETIEAAPAPATRGRAARRRALGGGVAALVLLSASPAAAGDANNDGFDEVVVAAPAENLGALWDAGMLHVLPGSTSGPVAAGASLWTEDTSGVQQAAGMDHGFGAASVWGDFDGDGYDDLAVGSPGHVADGEPHAGAVHVLYGTRRGVSGRGSAFFTADSPGLGADAEGGDFFGLTFAAGDFDGDGYDDLAVGAPWTDVLLAMDAGVVYLLYGSPGGLDDDGGSFLIPGWQGLAGENRSWQWFGLRLAAGDFDGDGRDDLAVSAPGDDVGAVMAAGSVVVAFGSRTGVDPAASFRLTQDTRGIQTAALRGEEFGLSLAAGDFDGDGVDDLAVGTPDEKVGSADQAGMLHVIPGRRDAGPTGRGTRAFTQDTRGIHTRVNRRDFFGDELAVGDFDGDGRDDLAVGAFGEDLGDGRDDAGGVHTLAGTRWGLTAWRSRWFTGDSKGLPGAAEVGDFFGATLATGDYNGDQRADLLIGSPHETVGAAGDAGAAFVLFGSRWGVTDRGGLILLQNSPGMGDWPETADNLGD